MPKGDIYNLELPYPQNSPGREQSGDRPGIIIFHDSTTTIPTAIIIPLTTKLAALRFPHTLQIEPTSRNGLSSPSVALLFQIRALDINRLLSKRGTLEQDIINIIDERIKIMLNFI